MRRLCMRNGLAVCPSIRARCCIVVVVVVVRALKDQFDHIGNRQREQLCAFMIYYRRALDDYVYDCGK